jgi:hydroxymethylbilane synthase
MSRRIVIGTRGSNLARVQTDHVADLLREAEPAIEVAVQVFSTRGDRVLDKPLAEIGGKGLFTEELEAALRSGEIDLAVHSLKDLPTDDPQGLVVAASPHRASPNDAFICAKYERLDALPDGARIGTSSLRRRAQLLARNPTWEVVDVRGNVETRMNKALVDGVVDAVILAAAGLERIGRAEAITEVLPPDVMLPAAAQGALGIQIREDDDELYQLLRRVADGATEHETLAERAFLAALGGGCQVPIGALAGIEEGTLRLQGCVCSRNGDRILRGEISGQVSLADALGRKLARQLLEQGAADLVAEVRA